MADLVKDVSKCPECNANNITLATPGGESRVEWCENGHVIIVDPSIRSLYKLVYDFHREEY